MPFFMITFRLRLDLNHEEKDHYYTDSFSLSHFLNPFPPFMFIICRRFRLHRQVPVDEHQNIIEKNQVQTCTI